MPQAQPQDPDPQQPMALPEPMAPKVPQEPTEPNCWPEPMARRVPTATLATTDLGPPTEWSATMPQHLPVLMGSEPLTALLEAMAPPDRLELLVSREESPERAESVASG